MYWACTTKAARAAAVTPTRREPPVTSTPSRYVTAMPAVAKAMLSRRPASTPLSAWPLASVAASSGASAR